MPEIKDFYPTKALTAKSLYEIGTAPLAEMMSTKTLENPVLDALGGAGQYMMPQRVGGALLGAYLGGQLHEDGEIPGAALGYGGAMAADAGIRSLRQKGMDKIIDDLLQKNVLMLTSPEKSLAALKRQNFKYDPKTLSQIMEWSSTPGLAAAWKMPGAKRERHGILSALPWYKEPYKDVPSKAIEAALEKAVNAENASVTGIAGLQKSMRDAHRTGKALFGRVPLKDSLRGVVGHELIEQAEEMFPTLGKKVPFEYGDVLPTRYRMQGGLPGILAANHGSPAVLMREMGLYARAMPEEALDAFRRMRKSTGEYQILKKLLGDVDPYSYIPPGSSIKPSSSALKILTDQIMKGKDLGREALEAIRPSALTRYLSRGAHSLRGLETSGKDILRKMVAYFT